MSRNKAGCLISRISLGDVGSFKDEVQNLEYFSDAYFRGSFTEGDMLVIKTPKELKKVRLDQNVAKAKKDDFLLIVDGYLADNGMYLAKAEYKSEKLDGIFPHRLKGLLYKIREA